MNQRRIYRQPLGLALLLLCTPLAGQAGSPLAPHHDPATQPGLHLPALPEAEAPLPGVGGPGFVLRGVRFEGHSHFGRAELEALAVPFVDRPVTLADLEELRYRLTRLYTDQGYLNSGVLIKPGQRVDDGWVTYSVEEGRLDEVRIRESGHLRPAYIRGRVWPDSSQPFNSKQLQERFQLLLQDPLIERMEGVLLPGVERGSAILDLSVTPARPYGLALTVDNTRPPSTGGEQVGIDGVVRNLTGHGDSLSLRVHASEGATHGSASFSIPLNLRDTRLSLRYDSGDSSVIEEPLDVLDIESKSRTIEAGISHPLWQDLTSHLKVGGLLAVRESRNRLAGIPFAFSPGEEADGSSAVTALRLWQEYQYREAQRVVALRSTLSLGLDWLGATVHPDDRPNGRFITWLGQAQYVHRVAHDAQWILRADLQWSDDALLPLERFALGGANSVRGYRENTLVRDQAYLLSAEYRHPLYSHPDHGHLALSPFLDYGRAWDRGARGQAKELLGGGVGLLWSFREQLQMDLYWGRDLKSLSSTSQRRDLQNRGIHFRLRLNLL